MPSSKQKQHAKQIFQATLDKFKEVTSAIPDKDSRSDLISKSWQGIIDSDELIEKLSSITNFEALVGYQRQFSTNLSYQRVIAREGEKSAEIDLAVHILRERRGLPLTRISETTDYKTPDFAETNGRELYEAKYLEKLSEAAIRTKINEALTQIQEYAQNIQMPSFGGTVHIFTYDTPSEPMELQHTVEAIKANASTIYAFPFNINLQTYSTGIYGDTIFTNASLS